MNGSRRGSTLLVGIDFSEGCEGALRRALTLAEQSQAQLELVHVVEWEGPLGLGADSAAPDGVACLPWQALAEQGQAFLGRLGQLCSHLVADRVPARIQVLIGVPAVSLLMAAQRSAAAFIVLGAQGRGRALRKRPESVGSTAERVYATSPIPVMLDAWPQRAPSSHERHLFPSALAAQSWNCSGCAAAQLPDASARLCAAHQALSCPGVSLAECDAPIAARRYFMVTPP